MAEFFANLDTDAGLEALNSYLETRSYIEGYNPTKADSFYFRKITSQVDDARFPHISRWYSHIASFGVRSFSRFPGDEPQAQKEAEEDEDSDESSSSMDIYLGSLDDDAPKQDDEDSDESSSSMDIYLGSLDDDAPVKTKADDGSDSEESSSSMDIYLGSLDDDAPVTKAEPEPEPEAEEPIINLGKRMVLDIFPPGDTVDLEKLAANIRELGQEGLTWGHKTEKLDLAFGLQKLRLEATIFEEIISSGAVEEKIRGLGEDKIQEVDVVSLVPIDPPKQKKSKKPDLEPIKEDDESEDESDSSSMDIFLGDDADSDVEVKAAEPEEEQEEPKPVRHFAVILRIAPENSEVNLDDAEKEIRKIELVDWGAQSGRIDIAFGIQNILIEGVMESHISQHDVNSRIVSIGGGNLIQSVDFQSMVPIEVQKKVGRTKKDEGDESDDESSSEMDIYLGDLDSDAEEAPQKNDDEGEDEEEGPTKNTVVLEIKPNDDETDLALMEKLIREIDLGGKMEWGPKSELVHVAFGLKLLRIQGVISNTVSTDVLEDKIREIHNGDMVQDADVTSCLPVEKKKKK